MSENQQDENIPQQPEESQIPLNNETAIQQALKIALTRGAVVKGISETIKALESQKAKVVFLAEDCDNDNYKNLLKAIAKEFNIPVIAIDKWEKLKDFCRLGLLSSTIREIAEKKGKEGKIKPRCSCCAILNWGENSEARTYIENNLMKKNINN